VPVPSEITVVNVAPTDSSAEYPERFHYRMGDGRDLPFADQSFQIFYSNSVIEHLRRLEDQRRFAREALRVGRAVFVQTPNRWFPIEPHFVVLFLHFLPKGIQRLFLPHFSLRGLFRSGDNVEMKHLFDELRLLSFREMQSLFPGCTIHRERVFGLTKSLIAIRKMDPVQTGGSAANSKTTVDLSHGG
jgi:SAM-dependent methyltransferase